MISRRELDELHSEWSLAVDVIEKYYVLGWLLGGICAAPGSQFDMGVQGRHLPAQVLVRDLSVSEDLDFTIINDGPEEPADLQPILLKLKPLRPAIVSGRRRLALADGGRLIPIQEAASHANSDDLVAARFTNRQPGS